MSKHQDDGTFTIKNGAQTLYNDLPADQAALWESRLIPQSYKVQETPLSRAAYEYIPSTYLICENDQAAPSNFQEMFAHSANAEIDRCNASHSPMLSQPDMLVKKIIALADKVTPKWKQAQKQKIRSQQKNRSKFVLIIDIRNDFMSK